MHFRQKLTFMALGSILTIAGYLLATLTSDVTAQPKTDKSEPLIVDEIVCRKLRVVDPNDKTRVLINGTYGGSVFVRNGEGKNVVVIGAVRLHGYMKVNHGDGENVVNIGTSIGKGFISLKSRDSKDSYTSISSTSMVISHRDKASVVITRGIIELYDEDRKGGIELDVDKYGGRMRIRGKTDNKARVLLGINERGHGSINTWDKNGYRTRP